MKFILVSSRFNPVETIIAQQTPSRETCSNNNKLTTWSNDKLMLPQQQQQHSSQELHNRLMLELSSFIDKALLDLEGIDSAVTMAKCLLLCAFNWSFASDLFLAYLNESIVVGIIPFSMFYQRIWAPLPLNEIEHCFSAFIFHRLSYVKPRPCHRIRTNKQKRKFEPCKSFAHFALISHTARF